MEHKKPGKQTKKKSKFCLFKKKKCKFYDWNYFGLNTLDDGRIRHTRAATTKSKKEQKQNKKNSDSFVTLPFFRFSFLFILSGTQHIFLQFNDGDDGGGGDYSSVFFVSRLMCAGFQCDRKVSMEFPFNVMHFSGKYPNEN